MNSFKQKVNWESKKIKAFTLIELIVVSSIMVLISATSVFYFIDFIHLQEAEQKAELLELDIQKYNQSIKNKEIYDYTMFFNTDKSEQWYVTYTNNFDIPFFQELDYNSISGIWQISSSASSSNVWKLQFFEKHKKIDTKTIAWDSNSFFSFKNSQVYKIIWKIDNTVLNTIHVYYFSSENLNSNTEWKLRLISIQNTEKNPSEIYTELEIKNIAGKKIFTAKNNSWEKIITEVYLKFDLNWKEIYLLIQ